MTSILLYLNYKNKSRSPPFKIVKTVNIMFPYSAYLLFTFLTGPCQGCEAHKLALDKERAERYA